MISKQDKDDFVLFLHHCTDTQVLGVYEKERNAGRRGYAKLARDEAQRRGLWLG